MDDKIRPAGRRVVNTADEDVWSRLENEAEEENYGMDSLKLLNKDKEAVPKKKKQKKKRQKKQPQLSEKSARVKSTLDARMRHQRTQKEQRLFKARIRALSAFTAAVIVIAAVLFLTPFFNIKSITVSGNSIVSADQVSDLIGSAKGTNLFLASKSGMEKQLKTIKYIKDVEISKSLFPPTVDIVVSEYAPAGYVQTGNHFLILDKALYIIDEARDFDLDTMPCITGMKVKESEIGSELVPESEETGKAVKTFLGIMLANGETPNIVSADFGNMNNISFNYDNKITVTCGSQIDLERKLRLFCETIKNENIGSDARGTIDLSSTGKAIYTP